MTEKNTTITVHTRERIVIHNLDGLDLRCGNCGASVNIWPTTDADAHIWITDRATERLPSEHGLKTIRVDDPVREVRSGGKG